MAITARRHAMIDRTRPPGKRHLGLAIMETLLALAWTLLLGAVARLLTGFYLYLLPLQYIISAAMVSWLECPVSAHRTNPLSAFGLVEASNTGKPASQWQTLIRVMFTPPFLLAGLVGFIPLLSGRRSLPEVLSGTRIVPLNPALDPRSAVAIRRAESRIRVMVRSYTVFSLAMAGLILLVPVRLESILDRPVTIVSESGLSRSDEQLLAIYLDLSVRNPEVVEFHVRLASLYYRNGMIEDLEHELQEVRRLDPDHAILVLGQDFDSDFNSIFPEPDTLSGEILSNLAQPESSPDSAGESADSLDAEPDSILQVILPADSLAPPEDPDTIGTAIDTIEVAPEIQDTLIIPEVEPPPAVIIPEAMPDSPDPEDQNGEQLPEPVPPPDEYTGDTGTPE